MSATTAERIRDDGVVQRQNLLGNTRLGAGLGWDFDADGVPLLTVGSMEQTLHGAEVATVRFEDLHGDALSWGSITASRDGPALGDPLWSLAYAGTVGEIASDDGTTAVSYLSLDHDEQLITLGSASAGVAVFGVTEGELVLGVAGGALAGLTHPGAADRVLISTAATAAWAANLPYATLPTGSGSWNFGADNVLTLQGQLVISASTTTRAGLLITAGAAPTGGGLVDGAVWMVNATGWFGRRNGATEQFAVGTIGPTQGGTGLTAVATGDLMYGSATNTWARLAIGGSDGSFVRRASGLPSWSTLTLPNTLAAGRILYTTGTDAVGGLAPTANRIPVADGSTWTATTLPFGALPTGASGTWSLGAGNTLTISQRTEFSDGIKVTGAYGMGGTTPANPRSITGSRGGNAALASLLTQGAAHGLWVDNTTA